MKTAISIPDELFQAAEGAAHRLGLSRSELYARAVRQFLEAADDEEIRRRLDAVYEQEKSSLDPGLARLQAVSLPPDEW